MKSKILISFLGLLLMGGAFGDGCDEEEPKPDFITVNVTVEGSFLTQAEGQDLKLCTNDEYNRTVRVDIIKAGGERFNLFVQTEVHCVFQTEFKSFKLYREQPIEIVAYLEQVDSGYTQIRGVDYLKKIFPFH